MTLFKFILLVVVIVTINITATVSEEKDTAITQQFYDCYYAILCKAREARAFRRIIVKAHEELMELGFKWLKEVTNISGSDTDEFWDQYPDTQCSLPEKTKKAYFLEGLRRVVEYWASVCMDQDGEKCTKMLAAEYEYQAVTAEYSARGICSGPIAKGMLKGAESMEKGAKQGKGTMENLAKKGGGWGK